MVTRLADGVWWFDLQGVNAYLLDGDSVTLVDTGMPWHADAIQRGVERAVGSLSAVDHVVLTHFDFDHVGGLNGLVERGLDAPVAVGVDDESYLRRRERPPWTNRKGLLQRVTDLIRDTPSGPIEPVADGETIWGFDAYHTPGHTPGHTVFVDESRSVAMVGDLVRERDGAFEAPPWYLNYDQKQAESSVAAYVDRAPPVEIVCQGHGTPVVERGSERLAATVERVGTDT